MLLFVIDIHRESARIATSCRQTCKLADVSIVNSRNDILLDVLEDMPVRERKTSTGIDMILSHTGVISKEEACPPEWPLNFASKYGITACDALAIGMPSASRLD